MHSEYVRGSDASLSYRWRADPAAIERLGLTPGRTADDRRVQASIIASLRIEADGQNRRVSYSRSSDFYDVPGRYRDTPYTKARVCRTIDRLAKAGLVDNFVQVAGAHLHPDEAKRIQSAARAYPALLARLGDTPLEYNRRRCSLILRDDTGGLVDFADTQRTERLRAGVDRINGWLGTMDVTVSPDADQANWRRSAHHLHARKVKGNSSETWACTLPTPTPEVVRIFSRSSFDAHGRYYGWWQGLPKARRNELLINGEVCIEPDFQWLHPTLLYAMAGEVIAHDPYTTGYWPRAAGKLAFNTAVNARTIPEAIGALLGKRAEVGDDGEPVWRYGARQTARILEDIREANRPIAHLFGSDAGVRLMRIDSDMATAVMEGCRNAGVPCLPVHDSFLTPARTEGVVTAKMAEVLTAASNQLYRGITRGSLRTILHNEGGGSFPASPASPVGPPPAPRVTPPEPPTSASAGPVSVDPGSVSPTPIGGPVSRTSVQLDHDLAVAFLTDLGHDPRSQEPSKPAPVVQPAPARPLARQRRNHPRSKIEGPVRPSLDLTSASSILVPPPEYPVSLPHDPPPLPRRSWEDCRRPSVWQVTEPDGTVRAGDPEFMAARAAEIRAMGYDPHRPRPPKIAPGL
ncbi:MULTISPECIES: hypothetical protein [unclassified Methylobacterium]|uniref:hypothetical protein n=1 Tax=unclassified Methylobacterium TaxID=2615210 RepID=UPI001FBA20D6|nr:MULTISPECIES: hypothetical protein [unclassified Methylobacterium]MCJ2015572.1 hypothetical protein [Methylobacterium sp. J-076]MCJ2089789.1 hypothetical protein [Methylobacterium sp. E-005]